MKIRKSIGYLVTEQREMEVDFILDETQILEIVNTFFCEMNYEERKQWIHDNVPEPNVVLVDINEEGDYPPFSL
jgi:hypothetical protein